MGFFAHFASRNPGSSGAWAVARGGGAAAGSPFVVVSSAWGAEGGTRLGGAAGSPGLAAPGAPGRGGQRRVERTST